MLSSVLSTRLPAKESNVNCARRPNPSGIEPVIFFLFHAKCSQFCKIRKIRNGSFQQVGEGVEPSNITHSRQIRRRVCTNTLLCSIVIVLFRLLRPQVATYVGKLVLILGVERRNVHQQQIRSIILRHVSCFPKHVPRIQQVVFQQIYRRS